jgi:gamma-glutamyltranspeptidase/glutathione hydrolase
MLEGYDLRRLGHNSPAYIHLVSEVFKLVMADREAYFGDPEFEAVPIAGLLHREYARQRRDLIRSDRAWQEMPPAGDPTQWDKTPWGSGEAAEIRGGRHLGPQGDGDPMPDTSFVAVVDEEGNVFAATPSDPATDNPLVPGLGLSGSSRGRQSRLIPSHPNSLAPWKRPRLTPMPALVLRNGHPWMVFGTPGGDVQAQAMAQVLCNMVEFGMDLQTAVDMPRFATFSFPNSFAPHEYYPGMIKLEERIGPGIQVDLSELGHRVELWPEWDWRAGGVCAIRWQRNGVLAAGVDPRRESYAMGW